MQAATPSPRIECTRRSLAERLLRRMGPAAVALAACAALPAGAATSVSQYGITWTFAEDRQVGQFVNGDWWVVGPVTLTNITPKTGDGGVTWSNGSMINPMPGQTQGFYLNGTPTNPENRPAYDAAKNISLRLPITVQPASSVYSTMNNPHTWIEGELREKTWFKETAVLTVLSAPPPAGSFRPPYAGTDKTIKANWNVSSLNFSVLKNHAIPVASNAPSLGWLEEATRRPLLEMDYHFLNSNWKATWAETKAGGYPRRAYGREVAGIAGGAGLMLNTNLTNAQKQKLAIHMCQWGIDTYGLLQNGMQYQGSGGHQNGRLLPVYLAGKLLDDPQILSKARNNQPIQEMTTHYFIAQRHIDAPRAAYSPPLKPYSQDMLGMPEWTFSYPDDPNNSAEWVHGAFNASGYRYVNGGANCGTVATILLMGGRAEVNHEAFFTYYINRYYPNQRPSNNAPFSADSNGVQPFVRDMWDVYLSGMSPPPAEPPPATPGFVVGDRIQVWRDAPVNSTAAMTTPVGTRSAPDLGTLLEGPVGPDSNNITWFRVDFDTGVDGWIGQDNFIKSYSPPASTIAPGDGIKVWRKTWVNETAAVTQNLGTQEAETLGVVLEGPVTHAGENIIWFRIDFGSGVDGWVGADNLVKVSSGSSTNPPSDPTGLGVVVDPDGNWSFEQGTTGWTVSGNHEIATSGGQRLAAHGSKLLVLNSANRAPNAVFSRTVVTTPGQRYELRLKVGVQAYNLNPQALTVRITGPSPSVVQQLTVNGDGLGASRWESRTLPFTASGGSVTIELRDTSASTDSLDLLVDDLVVVALAE